VAVEWLPAPTALTRAIGCTGVFLVGLTLAAAQPASVWSGVYTEEQAAAGEKVYFERCASCHGDDLAGVERAPALTGAPFLESWHGKDLRRLLDRIDTMPPSEPKTLSPAQAVAVLSFILRTAEMPSGQAPLPADRATLAAILFERSKP
jgi:S-disulfanyl-L-cysteine oxidoreductase SoxD